METQDKTQETSLISVAEWQAASKRFNGLSPIDYLFEKFANLYMSRWVSQFSSPKELKSWKTAWTEELVEEKVTFQEVKNGLDYCKKHYRDWRPTFPQFLEACRPSLDYEIAFHEAVSQMQLRKDGRDEWSNPGQQLIWVMTSWEQIINSLKLGGKLHWIKLSVQLKADLLIP